MIAILVIVLFLLITYIVLMLLYEKGWRLQRDFSMPRDFKPAAFISIIIPARNEEANIGPCISSILSSGYPQELFEIIVMDDHSTDDTCKVVTAFDRPNVRCLKLKDYLGNERLNSYKKRAIEIGIGNSRGDLIVTTDADCTVQKNWLTAIAAFYETEAPVMIIGSVKYTTDKSLLSAFQSLDFMSMQGITAAAHRLKLGNMSNGANLAFGKKAFYEVEGYKGIDHVASGDDYLLMMKMQKHFPEKIGYLKSPEAIVSTAPQPTWKAFLNQRIRWASKMGKYDDKTLVVVLMMVYLFNLSFLGLFIAGFFDSYFWILCGSLLLIKTAVELFYLRKVAAFFDKEQELWYFPFLQPFHILYIIVAGFLGFFGKYNWKGREVK